MKIYVTSVFVDDQQKALVQSGLNTSTVSRGLYRRFDVALRVIILTKLRGISCNQMVRYLHPYLRHEVLVQLGGSPSTVIRASHRPIDRSSRELLDEIGQALQIRRLP